MLYKSDIFIIFFIFTLFPLALLAFSKEIPFVEDEEDLRFGSPSESSFQSNLDLENQTFQKLQPEIKSLVSLHLNWEKSDYRVKTLNLMFSKFMSKSNKKYSNEKERLYRRKVFDQNMFVAGMHNLQFARGNVKYHLGITKFADWTDKEFLMTYSTDIQEKSQSNSLLTESKTNQEQKEPRVLKSYPDEVDFREKNIIGPVEDQGKCGSCYSFATVSATEAAYCLKNTGSRSFRKLSKQQMVDCGPEKTNYLRGCNGGVLESAYSYLREVGIAEASDYPYTGTPGKCKADNLKMFLKIRGYNVLREVNKDGILTMLSQQPISMSMQVIGYLKMYTGGIVDVKGPCGFFYNHAILSVGYDVDTEFPYFILKNTYGDDWGMDGYMFYQMGIGAFGMCAIINDNASAPVV